MNEPQPRTGPPAAMVARRLVILRQVAACSLPAPPAWRAFHDQGLWSDLTPWERELAGTPPADLTTDQRTNARWRLESVLVLMWALNLLEELPPFDLPADPALLAAPLPGGLLRSARLREEGEIEDARDLAELWDWRSRTRELEEEGGAFQADEEMRAAGVRTFADLVRYAAREAEREGMIEGCLRGDFPARGKAYRELTPAEWNEIGPIAMERHFALNWLCGYAPENRWDETPAEV